MPQQPDQSLSETAIDHDADQRTLATIKGLIMDGVCKAKSGHTGGAFSSLDFAYLLFSETLRFDPDDATWMGRDRFILSAGHESMLLYSMLHLIGWLPGDELKRFRQLHSKTPGHPENTMTKGVECTTGPLGQGVAMSVGFATASQFMGENHSAKLFEQKIFALCGDGDMQEDVTLGAASLAGHLNLCNLVWYYDRNRCQISGPISRSTSDDDEAIYRGLGWEVITIDGHDHTAIRKALVHARGALTKPLLIIGNTVMGKGLASMEGDHETHGTPLPDDERRKSKIKLGLPPDQEFYVAQDIVAHFQRRFAGLRAAAKSWRGELATLMTDSTFKTRHQKLFERRDYSDLPVPPWPRDKAVATRNAFGDVIALWADHLPNLVGGSADLEPSNMTGPFAKKVGDLSRNTRKGRNLAFGVREFPMAAMCNGMALYGGIIPFSATFLTFSDYSRPALRLGAIQKIRVIHEFTHDSFYLGEDGPTHQPVEHVMALRVIPNFYVMRPADAFETEVLMRRALTLEGPSAICLSRQKLPILQLPEGQIRQSAKGAYVVKNQPAATMVIMATGSEVSLALDAAKALETSGEKVHVVSMPCWELFAAEPESYRNEVLQPAVKRRVSIEAGVTLGWERYIGDRGLAIGLDHFGASAPMEHLAEEYGFTPAKVVAKIQGHRW